MIALLELASAKGQITEIFRFISDKFYSEQQFLQSLEDKIALRCEEITVSDRSFGENRHRLWCNLQTAFKIDPTLPLSNRSMIRDVTTLAFKTSKRLSANYIKKIKTEPTNLAEKLDIFNVFHLADTPTFEEIVEFEATKILGEFLRKDDLDKGMKDEVVEKIRLAIKNMPVDLTDGELKKAITDGDTVAIGAILASGSVVSLALAVELAGFSAYILAAKASAFIPFITGLNAVSGLAVLASGPFALAAVAGGGWVAWNRAEISIKENIASRLLILFALKGSSAPTNSCAPLVSNFRNLRQNLPYLNQKDANRLETKLQYARKYNGGTLPIAQSTPPSPWDRKLNVGDETINGIEVFSAQNHDAGKVLAGSGLLTYGDLLYYSWAIDPLVIEAADFSRIQDIDNLGQFSMFAERWKSMNENAQAGFEANLQGYVAEQVVLMQLVQQGHAVSLASTSNTAGYDLLVDGVECQVKCGQSLGILEAHFEKYPDIPVIANLELVNSAAQSNADWANKVFAIEGFDYETIQKMVETALFNGAALDELPLVSNAIILTAFVQAWRVYKGQIKLADLPAEIAIEAIIRGGVAWAGNVAGGLGGLVLFGPAGMIVMGPVGGLGAMLGSNSAKKIAEKIIDPKWAKSIINLTLEHKKLACSCLDRRIGQLSKEADAQSQIESWMEGRLQDDKIFALEQRFAIANAKVESPTDAHELLFRCAESQLFDPEITASQKEILLKFNNNPLGGQNVKEKVVGAAALWVGEINKRKDRKQ